MQEDLNQQQIKCPQCLGVWTIRSEQAAAVCKYGKCFCCLVDDKDDFEPDHLKVVDLNLSHGITTRKNAVAQKVAAAKELKYLAAASCPAGRKDHCVVVDDPPQTAETSNRRPSNEEFFTGALRVMEDYSQYLDAMAEGERVKAEITRAFQVIADALDLPAELLSESETPNWSASREWWKAQQEAELVSESCGVWWAAAGGYGSFLASK